MSIKIHHANINGGKIEGFSNLNKTNVTIQIFDCKNSKCHCDIINEKFNKYKKYITCEVMNIYEKDLCCVVGDVQSGKTNVGIGLAMLSAKCNETVFVILDNNINIRDQTYNRFNIAFEECGMKEKIKRETERINKGDVVILMGNNTQIKMAYKNLVNPRQHNSTIIKDEADILYKGEHTKFSQEYEMLKNNTNLNHEYDISATQVGIISDKIKENPAFKDNIFYLNRKENYKGWESCDKEIIKKSSSDFEHIKKILERGNNRIQMLVKTSSRISVHKALYTKLINYLKEGQHSAIDYNVFIVNSKGINCHNINTSCTKKLKNLSELFDIISNSVLNNSQSVNIIIGDQCLDRGISVRGDNEDGNVWRLTDLLIRKSKETDMEGIYQGMRVFGNFDDNNRATIHTDINTFNKLELYINDIYKQTRKFIENSSDSEYDSECTRILTPRDNDEMKFYTNHKKSPKTGNNTKGQKMKTTNKKNDKYIGNVVLDIESKLNDNRNIHGRIMRYLFDNGEVSYNQLLDGIDYENSGHRSDMDGLISNISNGLMYWNIKTINNVNYIKLDENIRNRMQELVTLN